MHTQRGVLQAQQASWRELCNRQTLHSAASDRAIAVVILHGLGLRVEGLGFRVSLMPQGYSSHSFPAGLGVSIPETQSSLRRCCTVWPLTARWYQNPMDPMHSRPLRTLPSL